MQIYFSKVEAADTSPDDDLFEHEGNKYDYALEVFEDSFLIRDTCDRVIPLAYTDIDNLHNALAAAKGYMYPIAAAEAYADKINSNLEISV